MKKVIATLLALFFCCAGLFLYSRGPVENTAAQVVDPDEQKKLEWDKSVTEEKMERLRRESQELKEAIKKVIATNYRKSTIRSEFLGDPANAAVGRKGRTSCEVNWKQGVAEYSIRITLLFDSSAAVNSHQRSVSGIALPEFYPAPDFLGKPAVLTKNLVYNKAMTSVGVHFVKGRLSVSAYLRNHKQTANQNEKDLIEFVRVIYPVLNAKVTFEEV